MSKTDKIGARPQHPCAKDCPRRSASCHSSQCEDWMRYVAQRDAWQKELNRRRQQLRIVESHEIEFARRYRKKEH